MQKQRLLTEVPLTFSIVKSRSFTCPKILLQIFQEQTLVFRWSAFPISQAMYHWRYCPSNLTKFWTSQNGSQKLNLQKSVKYSAFDQNREVSTETT